MERLTGQKIGQSYPLKDKASSKGDLFTDYDGFYAYFEAVNRLGSIEDILGDDYDLDRLLNLVEADRDGRCVVLQSKEVEPIIYAEWAEYVPPLGAGDRQVRCSHCGLTPDGGKTPRCPYCGAHMENIKAG